MIPQAFITVLICLFILASGCTRSGKKPGYTIFRVRIWFRFLSGPGKPWQLQFHKWLKKIWLEQQSLLSILKIRSQPSDQKIIKTADLQIEVPDVRKTTETIGTITASDEGVVQSSSVTAGREDQYSGVVTILIPSARFDDALKQVQNLGNRKEQ